MSFKKLVDATMKHGDSALTKASGGETNAYALSWWTKNLGYSRNAIREAMDPQSPEFAQDIVNMAGKNATPENFDRLYDEYMKRFDNWGYPNQMRDDVKAYYFDYIGGDQVPAYATMSDDEIALQSAEMTMADDGYDADEVRDPNEIKMQFDFDENEGNNYYDDAGTVITGPDDNNRDAWAPDEVAGWYDDEGNRKGIDTVDEADGDWAEHDRYRADRDTRILANNRKKAAGESGTERGRAYQKQLKKDQKRNTKESIRVNHPIHGNGIAYSNHLGQS